ncbi:hypothetical protein WN73_11870, partial [Bradyrhizobium sp. CCBAU 45394]|uniref:Ig-like domain-containing protein n=1 Tax=Bradyrhizobium sp. CCBAU 45394 TaxID=1325087 RepID=UPI0023041F95
SSVGFSYRVTDGIAAPVAGSATLDITPSNGQLSLTVALLHDSGISASDGITNDPTISGKVTDLAGVTDLRGGLDGTSSANFVSFSSLVQPDGTFQLGSAQLNILAGGALADGAHTLHLTAADSAGNTASVEVSFTFDSTPPSAPVFDLAATDQIGNPADHQTQSGHATLVGNTDPNAAITLLSTGVSTVASNTGTFQFAGVSLSDGSNGLTIRATDVAGNSSTYSLSVEKLATTAGGNAVVKWNHVTLEAIRLDASAPPVSSRNLAIESLAVLDTVNAINGTPGYLVNMQAVPETSADAAVAAAAHKILTYLYPAQAASLDAQFALALSAIPDSAAKTNGIALGEAVASQVIVVRAHDGWDAYVTDEGSTGVGQWRPTAPMYATALLPQWANLEPFAMTGSSQFLPGPPPDMTSQAYADAVNETKSLGSATSTTRTADQTQIARFWADGAGTYTPAGAWNEIAEEVSQQQGDSLAQDALLFAELNVAEADAGIAAWNAKYTYNAWRPDTAIESADSIGNPGITQDPNWRPLILDPAFPEYVSGHSTYSAAAATILTAFFGDNYAFRTTSTSLLGVTRSFTSFEQAAQEAGESRIYGGIHFEFSNQAGQTTGTEVGNWVLKTFDLSQDTTPPKVLLDQTTGLVSKQSPILTGHITDNLSGVAALEASIDGGTPVDVSVGADGSFALSTVLTTDGTADGAHSVALVAIDATGNATTPKTLGFTLDTKAPLITLSDQSVQSGGTLDVSSHLAGTADPTGSGLAALSYEFENGTAIPVGFNSSTGAFDTALDLSKLGAGAHTLTLAATDAAGNIKTQTLNVTLPQPIPLTITDVTPMSGAGDVGVTYRPKVTFSRAVDVSTLTSASIYATDTTGARVPATIVPTADGAAAWLFFTNPLPGASTITLHVDGSQIKDASGQALDADADGAPGGVLAETFTTVNTAVVPGTTIQGRVFDPGPDLQPMTFDDVRAGPDQILHTADDVYLNPLAHVKVYILGHESEAVYTDAQGNFTLTNVPTGDVKVAFDGRTTTNAPSGFYFPEMVMDTNIRPGVVNTIMGSMGDTTKQNANANDPSVYLPRLPTDILQTVSDTEATVVTPPADSGSVATIPLTSQQLSQLTLTVQPGSLLGADGKPVSNAQVGINLVPPSIVADMLPSGLMQHTFDITIQAPDSVAFSTPAQLTMPNVFGLAPGEKTYFLSFDHTTGRLVIDGTATASVDGLTVTSDPGSGITMPGWHGMVGPGSQTQPPPPCPPPPPCSTPTDNFNNYAILVALAKDLASCTAAVLSGGDYAQIAKLLSNAATLLNTVVSLGKNFKSLYDDVSAGNYTQATLDAATLLQSQCDQVSKQAADLFVSLTSEMTHVQVIATCANSVIDACKQILSAYQADTCSSQSDKSFYAAIKVILDSAQVFVDGINALENSIEKEESKVLQAGLTLLCKQVGNFLNMIKDGLSGISQPPPSIAPHALVTAAAALPSPDELAAAYADFLDTLSGVNASFDATDQSLNTLASSFRTDALPAFNKLNDAAGGLQQFAAGLPQNAYYAFALEDGTITRGKVDADGNLSVVLAPSTKFTLSVFDVDRDKVATYTGITAPSGFPTELPYLAYQNNDEPVMADGLTSLAAFIIGVDPNKPDNLVPGITDASAIRQGLSGNAALAGATGVVASLSLQGSARSISIVGSTSAPGQQTAYIATGDYGLAIVDATSFQSPKVLSQIDLAGTATDVGVDANLKLAAVATGVGGLQIVDVSESSNPNLVRVVAIDASAVQVFEGVAYVNDGASLDAIDLATGEMLQKVTISGANITGLARDGSTLYVMDANRVLTTVDISSGLMVKDGAVSLPFGAGKLFAADGVVYAAAADGFNGGYITIDVSNPAAPMLIETRDANNIAGTAIALNGSGLGVLVGNPGGAFGGNVLDVVNTSDPTNTGQFITRYTLPATPQGVAIGDGVAFVADGTSGLQVVNYRSFDTSGVAPAIAVTKLPTDLDANTPGIQVQEGQAVQLGAKVTDDVQVSNVQLMLNGQVVTNDVQYPWDISTNLPTIAANGSDQVTLNVRATDTGGNTITSDPIQIQLVPDIIPPQLISQNISEGMVVGQSFRACTFSFSEALDPATATASAFRLIGPGGVTISPLSIQTRAGDRSVQVTYNTLPLGQYKLQIDASQITDRAGNAMGSALLTADFTIEPFTIDWANPTGGAWSTASNWSTGQLPVSSDSVLIGLIGGPTVTFASGSDTVAGISIQAGDTLTISGGVLTVNGKLDVVNGSLRLDSGGTIQGAIIVSDGGAIIISGGTLSGVTYDGTMDLSANGSYVYVTNGLTMAGVNGTGPGTIDLTGISSSLNAQGSQTLDNALLNIGNDSSYSYLFNYDSADPAT